MSELCVVAQTHVGRHRDNNEDAHGEAVSAVDGARLFVVADGMGGFEAGELASAAAVEGAVAAWRDGPANQPLRQRLHAAVQAANAHVIEVARQRDLLGQTGTTLVALAVLGDQVAHAHVGDSRIYRLRGGHLELRTHDHTEAQELVDRGELAPELAEDHELSHCLTRALGLDPDVEIDLSPIDRLAPGDTWLLCSDGLTGPVAEEGIQSVLRFLAPSEAATALVTLANFFGGPDNITVQLVRVGPDVALEPRPRDFRLAYEDAAWRARLGCSILLALVVAIVVWLVWALL